jgi:hypothetical protein
VLELQLGHWYALFEGPLYLLSIRIRVRDHTHAQTARPVLDKLNISYLIPECTVIQVSERVAKERPPSSRDVNEGFLCPPDDRAGTGEVVAGATPGRIDGQVARVISDELRAEPVER